MRWSLRNTLLAILLPLSLATVSMSIARIAELETMRSDIEGLRTSALRAIYAERYAHYLEAMLKESFDHVAGRDPGLEAIAFARAGMADTLERLRPLMRSENHDRTFVSSLTPRTLEVWEQTQEQVDLHVARAIALNENGEGERARRLVVDELEELTRSRFFASIDQKIQREKQLLEEYRVRVSRGSESPVVGNLGVFDLEGGILPETYEAILAERFLRYVYADVKTFTQHVVEDRPLADSHGSVAGQIASQLTRLQRAAAKSEDEQGIRRTAEPAASYELIREAYAGMHSLPEASRLIRGLAVAKRLDDILERSLLPNTNAIIWANEEAIERDLRSLEHGANWIIGLTAITALIAILIGVASPYLAFRLLIRPVDNLMETFRNFGEGQSDARSTIGPSHPLSGIGDSLNDLLDRFHRSDRKLHSLAFYDPTTSLPNRQFFQERLSGALARAQVEGREVALLSLRMDGMKQIKETLGHGAGDEMIRQLALRLGDCVRLTDVVRRQFDGDETPELSHFGGDEFTIFLSRVARGSDASIAAERILAKMIEPLVVEGHEMRIRSSIGISVYPTDGRDADTLLRNSSAAMNEAKKRGGNEYQFYSETMNIANSRKLHIQSLLGSAVERDAFELYFQPIHEAKSGRLTGAEALLRWVDPEMGPVLPDEFIPIAEQSGLIAGIGSWVFDAACEQVRAWQEAGYADIRMAINTSAIQLADSDCVSSIAETLRATGISPGCIDLEITETSILDNQAACIDALTEISAMGVGVVLDDFGTGYSSLSHLKDLPISRIKIDRSFVSEISDCEEGTGLARAIVVLAHGLNLEVVAEGVETEDQANYLREIGCDELQGFLMSGPLKASEFERLMAAPKPKDEEEPEDRE